jgi:hypothetical protein
MPSNRPNRSKEDGPISTNPDPTAKNAPQEPSAPPPATVKTRWAKLAKDAALHLVRGAAYTLGGLAITGLVYWVQHY